MLSALDETFLVTVRARIREKNWAQCSIPTEHARDGKGRISCGFDVNCNRPCFVKNKKKILIKLDCHNVKIASRSPRGEKLI